MGRHLLPVLCLSLGLAGGFAGAYLAPGPASGPPPGAPAAGAPTVSPEDLARLESRVEEIAAAAPAPGGATGSPDVLRARVAPGEGPDAAAGVPSDRLAALEARVAQLEKAARGGIEIPEDLAKVATADLLGLARSLAGRKLDIEALAILEEVLARGDLDAKGRTDAEMQVGFSLRNLGRHPAAEARFRETLARVGEGSESGGWANFQIGWERSFQQDFAGASAAMERAADNPQAHVNVRIQGLLRAAQFARSAGDDARARGHAERLLGEFGDSIPPSQPYIRTQAEALLKELAAK